MAPVLAESFGQGETNFRAILLKAKTAEVDLIYLVAYPAEAKILLRQAREAALETGWLGTVVMLEKEMPELLDRLSYQMYFPAPKQPSDSTTPVRVFREQFRKKYGTDPPVLADVGYGAAMLLGKAVESGAAKPEDFPAALRSLGPMEMASGTIEFDSDGNVHKPMVMRTLP